MRNVVLASALLLASPAGHAQVTIVAPGSTQGQPTRQSDANYGPPRVADLEAILISDGYQRSHVITECEVSPFQSGQYWTCGRAGANVLIIPGRQFDASELDQVVGKRTEVRGIVRLIRKKEYVGIPPMDLDLIEDPILPPLPPPKFDQGWPRISITVFAIRDRTNPESMRPKEIGGGLSRQILDEPSAYSGKTTKILGQFRGRNLFGDLPAGSARGKDDWVLKDGDTAIWVMGKAPKGDGWKLDLDYKGDSKTWLEVEGKPEVMNGVVYLKASRVIPSKAGGTERRVPPPR
ncbi:MAG: hypothetical protein ABI565_01205 [Vicinamibacteria bacterium]